MQFTDALRERNEKYFNAVRAGVMNNGILEFISLQPQDEFIVETYECHQSKNGIWVISKRPQPTVLGEKT